MAKVKKMKAPEPEVIHPDLTSFVSGKFTPGQVVEHMVTKGLKLVIVSGPRLSNLNNVQYTIKTPQGIEMPVLEANLL